VVHHANPTAWGGGIISISRGACLRLCESPALGQLRGREEGLYLGFRRRRWRRRGLVAGDADDDAAAALVVLVFIRLIHFRHARAVVAVAGHRRRRLLLVLLAVVPVGAELLLAGTTDTEHPATGAPRVGLAPAAPAGAAAVRALLGAAPPPEGCPAVAPRPASRPRAARRRRLRWRHAAPAAQREARRRRRGGGARLAAAADPHALAHRSRAAGCACWCASACGAVRWQPRTLAAGGLICTGGWRFRFSVPHISRLATSR
jgi:hypothetical protein